MKRLFSVGLAVFTFLIAALGVSAQLPAQASVTKQVNGGVLNGKAVSLPKPEYPESARKNGIKGTVAVNVTIDESGNVIFAQADLNEQRVKMGDDGSAMMEMVPVDLALRESAENAARQARFSPTLLNGQGVKVNGKIVYNFGVERIEQTAPTDGRAISGGVLNGKASSLPLPQYPAAAKAVRAGGSVSVSVMIDEEGNVVSASAVSGHPLLRQASEKAALSAKFSPTLLGGKAVKIAGVLIYNFVPPDKEKENQ